MRLILLVFENSKQEGLRDQAGRQAPSGRPRRRLLISTLARLTDVILPAAQVAGRQPIWPRIKKLDYLPG